jgi:integrating conjugative element protein (TIGR03765 family)
MRANKNFFILALSLFSASVFAADYQEIANLGNTTPISSMQNDKQYQQEAEMAKKLQDPAYRAKIVKEQVKNEIAKMHVVETPELTVGKVETVQVKRDIYQSIGLVGCDKISQKWLVMHADQFKKYSPMFYVVNCPSDKAFKELQASTKYSMMAVNGAEFANVFKLKHYPVLITKEMVTQ